MDSRSRAAQGTTEDRSVGACAFEPTRDSRSAVTMRSGQLYRAMGFAGTVALTGLTTAVGSTPWVQAHVARSLRLGAHPSGSVVPASVPTLAVTTLVIAVALQPLYEPRSRRILDTITGTLQRLALAALVLATLGYFGFPYRPSQTTLVFATAGLGTVLPAWFLGLQSRYLDGNGRALVIGHDPDRIETAIRRTSEPVVGYASSTHTAAANGKRVGTDGGYRAIGPDVANYDCLGGLSRLDEILEGSNVGTVIPMLAEADRGEFFGVLATCHRHGVDVVVPDEHDESVLLNETHAVRESETGLTEIELEPWGLQQRLGKRLFDVCFAGTALLATAPLGALIAVAIKLDSPGPVFYRQDRTAMFGDTFSVYKFRSMLPESEAATPGEDERRITRVGRVLRRTHLDEIPQLWSILHGQMSVVGPRAVWTEEEELLLEESRGWQKRWFVKPGLTGLAQINDMSSETPRQKLQCDVQYIRQQSLRFDAKIIVRQLWQVFGDLTAMLTDTIRR